jgi:hypothetical protein
MIADTDRLLEDARLVAEQASRTGQLPDALLPKAIAAVEHARETGGHADYAALLSALNATIRAIAPITLIDLREGRSPFDAGARRSARRLVALLCVVSIALTALIGWYTRVLYQAESALTAIQQLASVRYLDKVRAVRRLAQDEEVFTKHDARYAQYHQQLGDLALARAAHNAAVGLITRASENDSYPFEAFFRSLPAHAAAPEQRPADQASSAAAPGSGLPAHDLTASAPEDSDPCSTLAVATAEAAHRETSRTHATDLAPKRDLLEDYCFLVNIGDDNPGILFTPTFGAQYTFEIGTQRMILSGWVLPFLYGLLGASVFLMRSLLNERTANMALFPVLLRLALGGIAGLVIGWFSVPGVGTSATQISSIPFGVAFLAGFSIDTLFALLERLTHSLSAAPRRRPANTHG